MRKFKSLLQWDSHPSPESAVAAARVWKTAKQLPTIGRRLLSASCSDSELWLQFGHAQWMRFWAGSDGVHWSVESGTPPAVVVPVSAVGAESISFDWSESGGSTVWNRRDVASRCLTLELLYMTLSDGVVYVDFGGDHRACIMMSLVKDIASGANVLYWTLDD